MSWLALVALVGIVIAIVLPSYGDYAHRSQASEAVSLLTGARTPLAEHYQNHKTWPKQIGEVAGNTSGRYTQSVAITKGAGGSGEIELTVTMRSEGVDRRVAGKTIRLFSQDGGKTWVCRAGTAPVTSLPMDCRPPG